MGRHITRGNRLYFELLISDVFPGESQIKGFVSQDGHRESQHTLVESQHPFPKSQVETCFEVVSRNINGFAATSTLNDVIFPKTKSHSKTLEWDILYVY